MSLRGLIPVEEGAGDQADQAHGHDGGGDAEADVHAGVGLEPNKESEGNELSHGEGKICSIEVPRKKLGLCWVFLVELVSSMGNHVWFHTPTP